MSALDDHIAHSVWCGVWEAHRNDDGELQSGPCSCDVDRARQELSALRAENARMREALKFYAERTGTYVNEPVPKGAVDRWAISEGFPYYNCGARDGGKIARAALGGRDEGS